MSISLRERMGLLFLAFLLLISLSVAATSWTIETQKQDALVINLAGRQRMLIEQMTRNALEIDRGEDRVQALQDAARTFDQTLQALVNGGPAPYSRSQTVSLPATWHPDILVGLYGVRQAWDTFRDYLDVITAMNAGSPEFAVALQAVEHLSPGLVQDADEVVRMYEAASAGKVARARWIQIVFFIIALTFLMVGAGVAQKSVIKSLRELGLTAERIGQGDLDTPVGITGPREIEMLARSLDAMRAQLKESQTALTAWAEELETRVVQRTRELAALHEVSREISSRLDINHVLRSVTDKARELLGGEIACLCLLDADGQILSPQAVSGPQEAVRRACVPVQHPLANRVLAGSQALPCGAGGCVGGCGIIAVPFRSSHLAAPLRIGERVIGALCVGSPQTEAFPGEAANLLTRLANSAAIALENARLYEQAERVATLEERQRIAAAMHDGLAQTLSYLGLKIEQAADLVKAERSDEALGELQRTHAAIGQVSQEVRRSIAGLQEGSRPRLTLQDALAETVQELTTDGQPSVDLVVRYPSPLRLSPDTTGQVLRVVREAVLNARRHAQAGRIAVCLEQRGAEMAVTVEDDGRGFDPETLPGNGQGHFGLRIMQARAARLGGQLAIHSTPGHGTQVILTWPVDR